MQSINKMQNFLILSMGFLSELRAGYEITRRPAGDKERMAVGIRAGTVWEAWSGASGRSIRAAKKRNDLLPLPLCFGLQE